MSATVLYDAPGPQTRRRNRVLTVVGVLLVLALLGLALLRLADSGQFENERWTPLYSADEDAYVVWQSLFQGLLATVQASSLGALIAISLGLVLVILRMSGLAAIRIPVLGVIELFRGLPVVLLMYAGVVVFGLPIFWGVVFGLAIYNGAIISEILRAGIVSLPKGQREAAYAIGLGQMQTLFLVLLPQAVRRMLPSLVSQLVVLNKDTSLGFIIAYSELLRRVQLNIQFFGDQHRFQFFIAGAVIYIAVNFALSRLADWLERRGSRKTPGGTVAKPNEAEPATV